MMTKYRAVPTDGGVCNPETALEWMVCRGGERPPKGGGKARLDEAMWTLQIRNNPGESVWCRGSATESWSQVLYVADHEGHYLPVLGLAPTRGGV